MKQIVFFLLLGLLYSPASAQEGPDTEVFSQRPLKGSLYATWGYNRAQYRNSDIHLKGEGYDFTLYDVVAHDRPTAYDPDVYLNIKKLTIPQFNFRLGYYLDDKWSVSAGWDHMKYVVDVPSAVVIDGYVDPDLSAEFGGDYDKEAMILDSRFLRYEHTDGLNYVRFGIERRSTLMSSNDQVWRLDAVLGLSTGVMLPWTDVTFLETRYENRPHVSGYAISAQFAARIHFKNTFFVQYQSQSGYIVLTDVLLQNELPARGAQNIWFQEGAISIGAQLPIYLRRRDKG